MTKTHDWQKIYSAYSPKLLGICRRYIQDIHAAEDVLQDSFMAGIQNIHQLKDEQMLFAWLKKIVVNNALQYLRKSSKETFLTEEPSEITEISFAMDDNTEEKTHVLAYDFTQEELLSSIDSLPLHHKSVFNLYFMEHYSHAEIASQLGITVNTSKSHLLRAKKGIQHFLLNHCVTSHTPKKKITQLLVFLGFANILWAQTFKTKFSGFSISPSRALELPEHPALHWSSFPVKQNFYRKTASFTIIGVTFFILTVSSVIIFRPNPINSVKKTFFKGSEKNVQNRENQKRPDSQGNTENRGQIPPQKQTEKAVPAFLISEEKGSNIKSKEHQKRIQDTAEAPKKIIVVKKIIQRDTIYIER
ncbi:RNA polymerase sigma factor [Chryseobacterium arthrosphaerae]|uniref:RNA polymerase sigma factor n=1 Tax=Chryseobacterium arthrosphaerae TaxID=651561 RepID=UPI001BAFE70F|nr:sigma-70 family RNA polymerase sigma factor [Chryseobacterium arthrosphaerae]QUY53995.1 sigma-70 family RNA polymerase sigma factor [Chryseobacterium arthrosphaerae]